MCIVQWQGVLAGSVGVTKKEKIKWKIFTSLILWTTHMYYVFSIKNVYPYWYTQIWWIENADIFLLTNLSVGENVKGMFLLRLEEITSSPEANYIHRYYSGLPAKLERGDGEES